MLQFRQKGKDGSPLPEAFKSKGFRSYVDMANFADEHELPEGQYFIHNTRAANLYTMFRTLTRKGHGFHVEGRGNI
jgi:hypothetical protein